MRTAILWGTLWMVPSLAWGLIDCSNTVVEVVNSTPPSWISLDRQYVVDSSGYVALVRDPVARTADYLFEGPTGMIQVRTLQGVQTINLPPPLSALIQIDPQYGGLFIPMGDPSPLLEWVAPTRRGLFSFRYFIDSPRTSADGQLIFDPSGELLWRPSEACQAGQIYAVQDITSGATRFEYSVVGGRAPLPALRADSPSAQVLALALVLQGGLLTERYTPVSPASFSLQPPSTTPCPSPTTTPESSAPPTQSPSNP